MLEHKCIYPKLYFHMAYNAFITWMAYQFSIFYLEFKSMIKIPEGDFYFRIWVYDTFGLERLRNRTHNYINPQGDQQAKKFI